MTVTYARSEAELLRDLRNTEGKITTLKRLMKHDGDLRLRDQCKALRDAAHKLRAELAPYGITGQVRKENR